MNKTLIRSATLGVVLLLLGSWTTTSAQPAPPVVPWRMVQGADGTLYLLTSDTRFVVNPDAISDTDLAALIDGGSLGSQLPMATATPATVVTAAAATPTSVAPTNTPVPTAPTPDTAATSVAIALATATAKQPAAPSQHVTVLSVHRPVSPPSKYETPKPGNEFLVITLRLDNMTTDVMSSNQLNFRVQLTNLVVYDSTIVSAADTLKCCQIAPGASVVGSIFFEVPIGVSQTTLIWDVSPPQQVDIR